MMQTLPVDDPEESEIHTLLSLTALYRATEITQHQAEGAKDSRVRRIYHLPADLLNSLLGRRDPLTPPKGRVFFGGGDFNQVGEEYLRYFVELGGLRPHERVLDVGCGIGRMAVPLTRYLDNRGSYEGIDVFPKGIAWCQENITPRYPNFRFRVADIKNKEYNPGGRFAASEYEFPYAEASFDFVLLTSVFTHLLPDEVENYLSEIERVLAPGGRCFASFFLLNEESLELLHSGRSTIDRLPETPPGSQPQILVDIRQGAQNVVQCASPVDVRVCFVVDLPAMFFEPKRNYSSGRGGGP
jgi:SAM-dependent methyltransferase